MEKSKREFFEWFKDVSFNFYDDFKCWVDLNATGMGIHDLRSNAYSVYSSGKMAELNLKGLGKEWDIPSLLSYLNEDIEKLKTTLNKFNLLSKGQYYVTELESILEEFLKKTEGLK